jgi:hypothetical protein
MTISEGDRIMDVADNQEGVVLSSEMSGSFDIFYQVLMDDGSERLLNEGRVMKAPLPHPDFVVLVKK